MHFFVGYRPPARFGCEDVGSRSREIPLWNEKRVVTLVVLLRGPLHKVPLVEIPSNCSLWPYREIVSLSTLKNLQCCELNRRCNRLCLNASFTSDLCCVLLVWELRMCTDVKTTILTFQILDEILGNGLLKASFTVVYSLFHLDRLLNVKPLN